MYRLLLVLCAFLQTTSCQTNGTVTCLACKDISDPSSCRDTLVCGKGEVCFTREFTDRNDNQGFRMGCEDQQVCDLLRRAQTVFGKREDSDTPDKCYECCLTNECNADLCEWSVEGLSHRPTTAKPHSPGQIPQCSNSGCPENFVAYNGFCYLFAPGITHWATARSTCQKHQADLLSITSKEEHEFLIHNLISINASYIDVYWTCGVYSHAAGAWEWMDGSPFNYAPWYPGEPPSKYDHTKNYFLALFHRVLSNGTLVHDFSYAFDTTPYGVICKKRSV